MKFSVSWLIVTLAVLCMPMAGAVTADLKVNGKDVPDAVEYASKMVITINGSFDYCITNGNWIPSYPLPITSKNQLWGNIRIENPATIYLVAAAGNPDSAFIRDVAYGRNPTDALTEKDISPFTVLNLGIQCYKVNASNFEETAQDLVSVPVNIPIPTQPSLPAEDSNEQNDQILKYCQERDVEDATNKDYFTCVPYQWLGNGESLYIVAVNPDYVILKTMDELKESTSGKLSQGDKFNVYSKDSTEAYTITIEQIGPATKNGLLTTLISVFEITTNKAPLPEDNEEDYPQCEETLRGEIYVCEENEWIGASLLTKDIGNNYVTFHSEGQFLTSDTEKLPVGSKITFVEVVGGDKYTVEVLNIGVDGSAGKVRLSLKEVLAPVKPVYKPALCVRFEKEGIEGVTCKEGESITDEGALRVKMLTADSVVLQTSDIGMGTDFPPEVSPQLAVGDSWTIKRNDGQVIIFTVSSISSDSVTLSVRGGERLPEYTNEPTDEIKSPSDIPEKTSCQGCIFEESGKCYPMGYRKATVYCSEDYEFTQQSLPGSVCSNNFECDSNVCIDNECVSGSFLKKIGNWFKHVFGKE